MRPISTDIVNNPYTYYKLDPGEPGIAPPTPASQSIFTVFAQESRNRTRLQAEALAEGKEVIFVNTEYKVRKNGSFITVVGGTTTVVTREKEKTNSSNVNTPEEYSASNNFKTQNSENIKIYELEMEEQRLTIEKNILRNKLYTSKPPERKKIETKIQEIENRLKDIKTKKQKLKNTTRTYYSPTYQYLFSPLSSINKILSQIPSLIINLYG